ncbi:MAG: YebC/PmpR family DNA-binding transcriptional regulator, partial [Eggerthella sp.]|nr:YebC/PmpR family DNA-binding transcriptional regulator [Eggerthella sp.]
MSGHSKWATTKHRKAAQDAKRSALFSKLSRNITVAAKEGGDPNPDNNASLAAAIEKAKGYSLPKDKIKVAIDKAFGSGKDAANYETTRAVRATVTINPRPAVIVANSATKTAGAADPIFTGTVTGLVRAGDLGAVSFGRSNAAEGVGFYPGVIGATFLANPNYSVTVVPGSLQGDTASVSCKP